MRNLKEKLWSKVLLGVFILSIFLAPLDSKLDIKITRAQNSQNVVSQNEIFLLDKSEIKDTSASFTFSIENTASDSYNPVVVKLFTDADLSDGDNGGVWNYSTGFTPPAGILGVKSVEAPGNIIWSFTPKQYKTVNLTDLKPNTNYFLIAYLINPNQLSGPGSGDWDTFMTINLTFKTGENTDSSGTVNSLGGSSFKAQDLDLGCGISTIFTNCLVAGLYYILFVPLSFITKLAAYFLDFFIFYSLNSDSYRSGFVEKAWSVVRDISNMFFIIALLYVGIKTVLDMHTSNNKRIISMIIIVALFINFSLFVSKVVIDSSNILARVFYANITPYGKNGEVQQSETEPKSISVGLVRTFEPQKVISTPSDDIGSFAIVTIIFIIFLLYIIFMFVSVSILFVARVAGLWIVMIFSPIAFASYTVPFHIPKFGGSEWWNQLFSLSFMAPIFTFFLYIIVLFGEFLTNIQYNASSAGGWLDSLMESIIPFVLIFVLLRKAKDLAQEYSGEIGHGLTKAGNMMGGLAVGAITGGAAMLGRGTIGALGNKLANSESLKDVASRGGARGYLARQQLKLGKYVATSSFDLRNARVAGQGMGDIGFQELGKAKTGGYVKMREDQIRKRQQRAAELNVGHGSAEHHELERAEMSAQEILRSSRNFLNDDGTTTSMTVADKLGKLDDAMKGKREEINDLKNQEAGAKDSAEKEKIRAEIRRANDELRDLKSEKKAIRGASIFVTSKGVVKDYSNLTSDGRINSAALEQAEKDVLAAQQSVQQAIQNERSMNDQVSNATLAVAQAVSELAAAEQEEKNAVNSLNANPNDVNLQNAVNEMRQKSQKARQALDESQKAKTDLENKHTEAKDSIDKSQNSLNTLNQVQKNLKDKANTEGETRESLNEFEGNIIPQMKRNIERTNKQRQWNYADSFAHKSTVGHAVSWVWNVGDYSAGAEHEAAHKIKMGAKIESGGHGGGDHGGGHDDHGGGHGGGHAPKPKKKSAPSHGGHGGHGGGHDDHGGGHGGGHH